MHDIPPPPPPAPPPAQSSMPAAVSNFKWVQTFKYALVFYMERNHTLSYWQGMIQRFRGQRSPAAHK